MCACVHLLLRCLGAKKKVALCTLTVSKKCGVTSFLHMLIFKPNTARTQPTSSTRKSASSHGTTLCPPKVRTKLLTGALPPPCRRPLSALTQRELPASPNVQVAIEYGSSPARLGFKRFELSVNMQQPSTLLGRGNDKACPEEEMEAGVVDFRLVCSHCTVGFILVVQGA